MLQNLDSEFVQALPVTCDNDGGYVAFEATSDRDRLNEGTVQRGANNTSVDAAMVGRRRNGQRVLIAIEWKYTEHYGDTDQSAEGPASNGAEPKGEIRKARYNGLIAASQQLRSDALGDHYREPFYQLMRQTLLAEALVAHQGEERLGADCFLHVHVIPHANRDLLDKAYLPHGLGMEAHWRRLLVDQSRYAIVDPIELLTPREENLLQTEPLHYLSVRYS